jgi:hypothetical protein
MYKVTGKLIKNLEIYAVTAIDEDNEDNKIFTYSDAVKLARRNELSNARAIVSSADGSFMLAVDGGIDKLPTWSTNRKATIIGRIVENGACTGYKVISADGKELNIQSDKVWELADQGRIQDIKARLTNKGKALISSGDTDLSTLPEN